MRESRLTSLLSFITLVVVPIGGALAIWQSNHPTAGLAATAVGLVAGVLVGWFMNRVLPSSKADTAGVLLIIPMVGLGLAGLIPLLAGLAFGYSWLITTTMRRRPPSSA